MTTSTPDPFAEQEKLPSVSFKDMPVGTTYTGDVVEAPAFAQSRDFETNEPLYWNNKKQTTTPSDNPVMSIVTVLDINGERRGLWASKWNKPGSMFAAIQEAQKAAGAQIAVGGRLTVQLAGLEPSDNPKLSDRKLYRAQYVPPNPFAEQIDQVTGEVANQPSVASGFAASQGPMPDWAQPAPPAQQPQAASSVQPMQNPYTTGQPVQPIAPVPQQAPVAQAVPAPAKPQATPETIASLLKVDPSGATVRGVFPELTPEAIAALANLAR